jgi:uncharacterized protein (UPF0261 family)
VRDELTSRGIEVVVVDIGVLGEPSFAPDVTAADVAEAAGSSLGALRFAREGSDTRAVALETMQDGAARVIADLRVAGRCDGVLGLGGSGGTALISAVMRTLPLGVPKLVVSTMASGDVGAYVGSSDLCIMHSVTDIAGLNRISRPILRNAAGALAGMITTAPTAETDRPAVGITMLGVTTPGALRIAQRLEDMGFDPIVFHAVGSGGRALGELVDQGILVGVVDFTVKEITDELFGGVFDAGPRRLVVAGEAALPQVVIPGAIEVLNFGAVDTVPVTFRDGIRPLVRHNAQVTAVRLTAAESVAAARVMADRLNRSLGPLHVLIPTEGFDSYDQAGGPFWDPAADAAVIDELERRLRPDIRVTTVAAHINDRVFADAVADAFLELVPLTL